MNFVGRAKAGSSAPTMTWVSSGPQAARERVDELLVEQVADHALGPGSEHVERIRGHLAEGDALQGEQSDRWPVAVGHHGSCEPANSASAFTRR